MLRRSKVARDSIKISKQSYYYLNNQKVKLDNPCKSIVICKDKMIKREKMNKKGEIIIENKKTLDVVLDESEDGNLSIAALNFANGMFPGGGYRWGANSQEEDFFRKTNIRETLNIQNKFYYDNWIKFNRFVYHNNIIISENVSLFKDKNYELLNSPVKFTVISSAAVAYNISKYFLVSRAKSIDVMRGRIRRILEVAELYDIDILILGAFGCGVYGNKKKDIAKIFMELLSEEFKNSFEKVIFPVPS